jgi:hypothetical protein
MASMIYLALLSVTSARSFIPLITEDLPMAHVSQLGEACGYDATSDFTFMCVEGLQCSNMAEYGKGICEEVDDLDDLFESIFSCKKHRGAVLDVIGVHPQLHVERIWLPECQEDDEKLYKKLQCNIKKYDGSKAPKKLRCFRVDELTGEEM